MRVGQGPGFPTLTPAHALARTAVNPGTYTLFDGFAHLASGLACGLAGLAAGMAIGIVGDAGVRWVCGGMGKQASKQGQAWVGGGAAAGPALPWGAAAARQAQWWGRVTHPPVLAFHASAARPHTRQPNKRFSCVGRASLTPSPHFHHPPPSAPTLP